MLTHFSGTYMHHPKVLKSHHIWGNIDSKICSFHCSYEDNPEALEKTEKAEKTENSKSTKKSKWDCPNARVKILMDAP